MAYEQHTWQSNDLVTAEKLNNMENGIAYSQGKKWEVTIAANNWTLSEGVYTYSTTLGDITSASWVDANAHGYEDYFSAPIDWEVKNNNVVEFSTNSAPTGTVVITVVAWGTVEGTEGQVIVPIYDGVDSTDANKALSAKQGKIINDKVSAIEEAITPFAITITAGQWSGTGSDRYITVNASNVTENSILIPRYDHASAAALNGPVWCVPDDGSFTIHTTAIPDDSVTIVVLFAGTMGEAQYQVLADVYSTSQAVAKADVVNNLTSGETNPPSAGCVYDAIANNVKVVAVNISSAMTISAKTNDFITYSPPAGYIIISAYIMPGNQAAATHFITWVNIWGGEYRLNLYNQSDTNRTIPANTKIWVTLVKSESPS